MILLAFLQPQLQCSEGSQCGAVESDHPMAELLNGSQMLPSTAPAASKEGPIPSCSKPSWDLVELSFKSHLSVKRRPLSLSKQSTKSHVSLPPEMNCSTVVIAHMCWRCKTKKLRPSPSQLIFGNFIYIVNASCGASSVFLLVLQRGECSIDPNERMPTNPKNYQRSVGISKLQWIQTFERLELRMTCNYR